MQAIYKISLFFLISFLSVGALFAEPTQHFNVKMQNRSTRVVTLRFEPVSGNVSLQPQLNDYTPLQAGEYSATYGVYFDPLTPSDSFKIIFRGNKDCVFKVEYFAPGSPKISMSGYGCKGGGYQIVDQGQTLLLYVSEINLYS
jgi:hypothetical protein